MRKRPRSTSRGNGRSRKSNKPSTPRTQHVAETRFRGSRSRGQSNSSIAAAMNLGQRLPNKDTFIADSALAAANPYRVLDHEMTLQFISSGPDGASEDQHGVISLIKQGSGATERTGNQAVITAIHINGWVYGTTIQKEGTSVRIVVLYQKEHNGAAALPTSAEVFDAGHHDQPGFGAFRNLDRTGDIQTVADFRMDIPAPGGESTATNQMAVYKHFNINKSGQWPVTYNAVDPALANMTKGVLFIYACQAQTAAEAHIRLAADIRIRFVR